MELASSPNPNKKKRRIDKEEEERRIPYRSSQWELLHRVHPPFIRPSIQWSNQLCFIRKWMQFHCHSLASWWNFKQEKRKIELA